MTCRLSSPNVCLCLSLSLAGLSGCGLVQGSVAGTASGAGSQMSGAKATGIVHGGQAPIVGSTIQLYAVGTAGYGLASNPIPLIGATLTTSDGTGLANSNANAGNNNNALSAGSFTITGAYNCPTSSTLVYLVASGGNPGLAAGTNNSAIVLMAPLGQCGSLTPSTFVSVNEVTTVASAYALQTFANYNFTTGQPTIGSPASTVGSLASSFGYFNDLVNLSSGNALATDAAGNAAPQTTIDTIANILTPCVNSTGPTSANCTSLFSTINCCSPAPTNVFAAAFDIASASRSRVSQLFSLSTANAPFQPALTTAPNLWAVIVGGSAQSECGYSGNGYSDGGTVSYSGTKTGRIYLALIGGCGGGTEGTSIPSPGSYGMDGFGPGNYTLTAFMDTLGTGAPNAADPTGSTSVTVTNSGISANVTLTDPATVTLTSAPSFRSVSGFNSGAIVLYNPIKSNGVEAATSYTLQWSTSSSFSSVTGFETFPATGTNTDVWIVNGLIDGGVYYFRVYGSSAGTAIGPFSSIYGPVTIGAPSSGSAVSGTVTFPLTPTGPLYAGLYNQYTGAVYLQYIASPASSQAYTVVVPNSAIAVYEPVAVLDQNNNGVIDTGDLQNLSSFGAGVSITAPTANLNVSLPSGNSNAFVVTQHYLSGSYGFNFVVGAGAKLPVYLRLLSSSNADGANVNGPIDVALCGQSGSSCGHEFQIGFNLGTTVPAVGDTYFFSVTYSDGTVEMINVAVTGVVNNFATNLAPTTGTSVSTTPTFTWTAPVCGSCSSYVYDFSISPSNGNDIWDVPGNANGLPYTTTSLTWGIDPTYSANTPSPSSLTLGANYSWSITVEDTNGNTGITQASYTP